MGVSHCAPGRLPALNDWVANTTLGFFKQYGTEPIRFWTTLEASTNQALTYVLKWESLAEREAKWNAFQSDPDWIAQWAATEAEQIIVERVETQFLSPTAYSALK